MNKIEQLGETIDKLKPYGIWYKDKPILTFKSVYTTNFSCDNEITDYPIENPNGYKKNTDYMYQTPSYFTVVGVINREDTLSANIIDYFSGTDAVLLMKTKLEFLQAGIYKLKIKTREGFYTFYTLKGYSIPEDVNNVSILEVHMNFKRVTDRQDWNDMTMREIEFMNTKYGGSVSTKIIKSLV